MRYSPACHTDRGIGIDPHQSISHAERGVGAEGDLAGAQLVQRGGRCCLRWCLLTFGLAAETS
jgi:hypothetical protein